MTVPPSSVSNDRHGVSHARRRNRDYKRDSSLDQAKQQFMSTVDDAISNLMLKCGYSRPRATAALLHEFRRDVPTPTDDEVFLAMRRYGLGIEEATRALLVSSTMMRAVKENGNSFIEAIDDLTERLSLTNMRAMSECTDFSDVEERPRSPDRRIEAVPTALERTTSISRKQQQIPGSSRKAKASTKNGKAKSSSTSKLVAAKTGAIPKPASRKRLIDETTSQSDKKVILREIPDPARDDDVDAQVAMKCKEDDGSLSDCTTTLRSTAQSVVPRAKRTHRVVDDGTASSQTSALKRPRTSDV